MSAFSRLENVSKKWPYVFDLIDIFVKAKHEGEFHIVSLADSVDSVMLLSCVGTFEQDNRISVHVVEFDYGVVLSTDSLRKACTFDR